MIINDQRTPEQKETHHWAVVARDKFMSNWGQAKGGFSRCAWAMSLEMMKDESYRKVVSAVKARSEMMHVNLVDLKTYRCPKGTSHFSIYVVNNEHPYLQ